MNFSEFFKLKVKIIDTRITEEDIAYHSKYAAGIDLFALPTIDGSETGYGTGIAVEIPRGWVGIICPRSSAGKRGYALKNTIGVIDSDFRGELRLLLNKPITEKTRIAQLMIVPCPQFKIDVVDELSDTERGDGGFGSTGI